MRLLAPVIQSVSVDPSPVSAGTATTGVVVMRGKAGLTPVSVRIRAVRPNGFNITMPNTLSIPLGQNSGAFAINVITAPRVSKGAVYAVYPSGTKSTTFVAQP